MKILLTGAAGFTGLAFAAAAGSAGHEVVALQANLLDKDALTREVGDVRPEGVVHLAAISFVGHADEAAFYAVNTIGTTSLLSALASLPTPPRHVLLASSANIYGNCDASPIQETQPPSPVNHYATSKLAMELMARTFDDRLPIVVTRPFNYTGPGQEKSFLIPKLVEHFARKAPTISLGNLQVEREFNDIGLVCEAYLGLLTHGEPGQAYNVCSGRTYTLGQVLELLRTLTGHTIQVEVNPAFVRPNEVHRLSGSPDKLHAALASGGITLTHPPLAQTLTAMLQAAGCRWSAL